MFLSLLAPSERAHCVPIEDEIKRRGIELKRQGAELVGPCPVCGGRDRFGVNTRKQVWNCRKCNVGGDVIALARHVDGCNFVTAVVTLGGDAARKKAAPQPKATHQSRRREWCLDGGMALVGAEPNHRRDAALAVPS
jgi:phage/plasmid primase-like uncharacterized protein